MAALRRLSIRVTIAGSLCIASAIAASSGGRCPNQGVRFVPTTILDAVDASGMPVTQDCPIVQLGVGIPGMGQIRLVGLGSQNCPVAQDMLEAHHEIVAKEGFKTMANGSFQILTRKVGCSSSDNLILLGVPNCEFGPWQKVPEQPDYSEASCAD